MLALTTKSKYGIEAVMELAKAYGQRLIQIREIVERVHIPKNYLEQIFNRLGKLGIISSVRGSRGGYALAQHPSKITLLQVLEALEGEIEISKNAGVPAFRELLLETEKKIRSTLAVTIAELLTRQRTLDNQPMYYI